MSQVGADPAFAGRNRPKRRSNRAAATYSSDLVYRTTLLVSGIDLEIRIDGLGVPR